MGFNLSDVAEWKWREFIKRKGDLTNTEYEDSILGLIMSITEEKTSLASIKRAIERVDGKQAENIKVEYPKFYISYPNVKNTSKLIGDGAADAPEVSIPGPEMATAGIRGAIADMSSRPRGAAAKVLELATRMVDDPDYETSISIKVKEVIASALIVLSKTKQGAMEELLNQIDGKVATTFKLLGDDVYFTRYDTDAPRGGFIDKDGVYVVETKNVTDSWALKLGDGSDR